jgi:hypothetical protein
MSTAGHHWSVLSNHGLVLTTLARRPDMRLRDVAAAVGITERSAQAIVTELVLAGYLERIREGRRNRYVVRGDRPLIHPGGAEGNELAGLLAALVPGPLLRPSQSPCEALVLACCDFRYQEPLRNLMAEEGLLGKAEMILLPGGASALAGRDGGRILAALETVAAWRRPGRVFLVAHHGCAVPGAFIRPGRATFDTPRAVSARRRQVVTRVQDRLGLEPELWFLDDHGAHRFRRRVRPAPPAISMPAPAGAAS